MPLIDIIVIGGGPGGLHAATELSQRGFQVVVLEEHGDAGENVLCTGIIGTQAFQEFSLPQETVVGSLRQTRAHGRYGTEVVYTPAQPLAYIVDKAAFNRALASRAARHGRPPLHSGRTQHDIEGTARSCGAVHRTFGAAH